MVSSLGTKTALWLSTLCVLGFGACGCEGTESPKKEPLPVVSAPKKAPAPEIKAASPEKPAEGSVRLVVVGASEPLASEKVELGNLEAALGKAKLTVDVAPASADEKQAGLDLANQKPVEISAWSRFETVIVLQVVEPEGSEKGKRISRGRGHLFLLHPPKKEPSFSTIYETNEKGAWLDGARLGAWIATHLRFRRGVEGEEPPPEKDGTVLVKKESE